MSWQALAEAHERSMSEVRERMMIERDRAVEREREASSVRLREQNDRFDQQLQAQRVRLADDMAQERERLARKNTGNTADNAICEPCVDVSPLVNVFVLFVLLRC